MTVEVLRIERFCKRFGGIVAADDVSLAVRAGEVVGLIGPNGSGKTTLFNLVTGILPADSGSLFIDGTRAEHLPVHDRAALGIARTWQHTRLFASLSLADNLIIAARVYPGEKLTNIYFRPRAVRNVERAARERAMNLLTTVGLAHRADALPTELSYGQQKLVGLCRALMNDGQCVLLDEPMAGVSGSIFERITEVVRAQASAGKAIVIVEHNVSFVRELCSRAVFMFGGRIIAAGPLDTLIADPNLTQLYFGASA